LERNPLNAAKAILERAWQLSPNDFQICWTLSQKCPDELDRRAFAMAALAAAPDSPFARELDLTVSSDIERIRLLRQDEHISKGEKTPEWKFPHVVIESTTGEKCFLGPTRYEPLDGRKINDLNQLSGELPWAIRLQPANVELRKRLAKLLVRLGRYDEAAIECDTITKLDPDQHAAHIIGEELYGMGQLDRAKALIEK